MSTARTATTGRRRPGSVRFDPYWKVQVWEDRSLTWKDVQKAHPSPEQAWAAAPAGQTVRLMHVYPGGRAPVTR